MCLICVPALVAGLAVRKVIKMATSDRPPAEIVSTISVPFLPPPTEDYEYAPRN